MGQYNVYVEDHFFFVKQQKEGSNDLATHILRIVGRGSLLSLSHGRKLYKKHWGFKQIFFSGQILSEKYITRKERVESKNLHAKLWTTRVWYGTQPPIYSLFTECSVYFIYVGWLSLNKCWEKSVRLYKMPDVPIFPKNGTSRVHTKNVKNTPKLKHMNASFNLKFECLRMWVQSVTNFASKQNFLTYTLEERHSILLQPNLIFG